MKELEKTYLLKTIPKEISNLTPTRITDVYIPETAKHSHLRLRQKGTTYEITKKLPLDPSDASSQQEETISLTADEYHALASCSNKRVVKDRFKLPVGNHTAEIDVFKEALSGLIMADFEFSTEEEKASFTPPAFVLADVTQEEFVAGGFLSGKSYSDLEQDLKSYNYKKF